MTGSSVDEERMVAERLLAEQLMDLPDTALSGTGLVLQSCKARVLKTSKSRPILRYIVTCLDREKAAPVRRLIIGKGLSSRREQGLRFHEATGRRGLPRTAV